MLDLSTLPPDFIWGIGDRRLPDRGRRRRRRAEAVHLGHLLPGPRRDRQRRHRRCGLRPLPPLAGRYQDHAAARGRRLPVLGGLAPGRSPTASARSTRPASTSTTGWSTRCWPTASGHWSPCTTGICPRRCRSAAAGRSARPRRRWPTTRPWSPAGSATGSPTGTRSTSRSAWPGSATSRAGWPRASGICAAPCTPRTTSCSATGSPSRRSGPMPPARPRSGWWST